VLGERVRFRVRVTPRASRAAVGGLREGELLVRVSAPPVEGAANDAVIAALAEALRIPRRDVRLEAGARGRSKLVSVPRAAYARLRGLADLSSPS
jgi:uncharacterized protein (TIGR00251 family)